MEEVIYAIGRWLRRHIDSCPPRRSVVKRERIKRRNIVPDVAE